MSKQTKTPAPTFNEGDRVIVTMGDASGPATYLGTNKGWYVVDLDDAAAMGRKTARASVRGDNIRLMEVPLASIEDRGPEGIEDLMPEEEMTEEEKVQSAMSRALQEARKRYVKAHRPNGARTAHNGDAIARELIDLEPLEVADLADDVVKAPKGTHRAKYQHLNPGQIRMNSGNRIRAYWKTINEEGDAAEIKRVGRWLGLVAFDDEEGDE